MTDDDYPAYGPLWPTTAGAYDRSSHPEDRDQDARTEERDVK